MHKLTAILTQIALVLAVALLIVILVLGSAGLWGAAHYQNRIYWRVSILDVPVGGLTRAEALQRLELALADDPLPYLSLQGGDRSWLISSASLGARLDLESAVWDAWTLGRYGTFRDDWLTRLHLLDRGYRIVPEYSIDPDQSLSRLRTIGQQVGRPVGVAQLRLSGTQTEAQDPQTGLELDEEATRQAIEQRVVAELGRSGWGASASWATFTGTSGNSMLPTQPVAVPLQFRSFVPPSTDIEAAQEQLDSLLSRPLILEADLPEMDDDGSSYTLPRRWAVDPAELSSWLVLETVAGETSRRVQVGLDPAPAADLVERIEAEIARPPRDARLDYDPATDTLTPLATGQVGHQLDATAALRAVEQAVETGQHRVTLPVQSTLPRVTLADVQALLPLALISEGESSFAGSTAARLQNIRIATQRFNGLLVPPDSDCSFLDHLGLVTAANGYSESWIIYGDRTLLGPGGGVCQVGTTFFRAAFWGGYPIVERSPHAYRVGWYEPPVGLDASIYSPSVDCRFHNDTDSPILILTEVDEAQDKLYFRFYGRAPDRTVRMEGPELSDPETPGDPVEEVDPTLAPGQRILMERAHEGVTATLYRIIERDGEVLAREEFVSHYKAWPARYRVGPSSEAASESASSESATEE